MRVHSFSIRDKVETDTGVTSVLLTTLLARKSSAMGKLSIRRVFRRDCPRQRSAVPLSYAEYARFQLHLELPVGVIDLSCRPKTVSRVGHLTQLQLVVELNVTEIVRRVPQLTSRHRTRPAALRMILPRPILSNMGLRHKNEKAAKSIRQSTCSAMAFSRDLCKKLPTKHNRAA